MVPRNLRLQLHGTCISAAASYRGLPHLERQGIGIEG